MDVGIEDLLFPEICGEVEVVLPLDAACFAVDVDFQLLHERLAVVQGVVHPLEIALHAFEELLLVDVAVEMAEDFVAAVVANPAALLEE
jgi:hypothetical protein